MNKQTLPHSALLRPMTIADFIEAHASSLKLGEGNKIEFVSKKDELELKNLLVAIFDGSEQEISPQLNTDVLRSDKAYVVVDLSNQNSYDAIILKSTENDSTHAIQVLDFINLFAETPLPEKLVHKDPIATSH